MVVKQALRAPVRVKRPLIEFLSRIALTPGGVSVEKGTRGGVGGEVIVPDGVEGPVRLLYLHGGGYVIGSPATQRGIAASLALEAGVPVFSVDYRLAPEHPCPAAIEDVLAAWGEVAGEAGAGGAALAGDSAGGGVALAGAIEMRERGQAAPAALALISPWVDLTMSGPSYTENDGPDAILASPWLRRAAGDYRAGRPADDPLCSPLFGSLAGLPPTLVHAGAKELLLSDAQALAERASAAGVEIELRVFGDLWHGFHIHAGMLAEADEALAAMGAWLVERLRVG